MSDFKLAIKWLPQKERGVSPSTLCSMQVLVGDRNVTEYIDDDTTIEHDRLEIPAYYLAEWIAENWWPLLCEPRKSEDSADAAEFLTRHSFLSAQHGFALPKVTLVPAGGSMEVLATARTVPLANVRFKNSKHALVSIEGAEAVLRGFVDSVVKRLQENQISETFLQDTWSLISETSADEVQFCKYAGALGLSPYDLDERFASFIEQMAAELGEDLLKDLCLVSTPETFRPAAAIAQKVAAITRGAVASTLGPLSTISAPKDNPTVQAHRRGVNAARIMRNLLNISDTDPRGASKVFELLRIDTTHSASASSVLQEEYITGAVVRSDQEMKVALLQASEVKRRFAGARAIFAAWASESMHESRLLTSAITRDQQANRAFAAELTAPLNFIRQKAKGRLSVQALRDLAGELHIGDDVVRKQASNNGLLSSPV